MRLHVAALPHTHVARRFEWCAYTGKLLRFGSMLRLAGHDVILYGSEECDAQVTEHVAVVGPEDRARWFGGDWPTERVFDRWDDEDPCWVEMNRAVVGAMRERFRPGDAVGVIAGRCQAAIADAFPAAPVLEWGCGYEGVIWNSHIAFESNAWRHWLYGRYQISDGRPLDAVVPNAYDPADYHVGDDLGYLLYLGRWIPRKGAAIVETLAERFPVITAGQGTPQGVVVGDEKRDLIAHATAVLVPTRYIEPFGGVAVEAQMSGVPAITSDFGAFCETVEHGVTGFRCNTMSEFCRAVEQAPSLDRSTVRRRGAERFSLDTVARLYDGWFERIEETRR